MNFDNPQPSPETSLTLFLNAECIRDPEGWVSCLDIYEKYIKYCDRHGIPQENRASTKLPGRLLSKLGFYPKQKSFPNDKCIRGWTGLRLLGQGEEKSTTLIAAPKNTTTTTQLLNDILYVLIQICDRLPSPTDPHK